MPHTQFVYLSEKVTTIQAWMSSKTFSVQDYLPPPHRCPTRMRDSESSYIVVGSPIPLVSIISPIPTLFSYCIFITMWKPTESWAPGPALSIVGHRLGVQRHRNLWPCDDWKGYSPEDQNFLSIKLFPTETTTCHDFPIHFRSKCPTHYFGACGTVCLSHQGIVKKDQMPITMSKGEVQSGTKKGLLSLKSMDKRAVTMILQSMKTLWFPLHAWYRDR